MLEFQEGFFNAEIREGFFIDSTMKTVWAAEMEVLQTVAVICDKYGLTWYAGFGTMLGAIRHEGFIPWDDDMDIMMLREDYMKLMKVLPEELPDGYWFRSPFSEEGYTEYHTCIMSGRGISIAPEFLNKFHNCPFTVGLDIFPMDYLPRDRQQREIQKNLFIMAARVTQMARNFLEGPKMGEGDKDKGQEYWLAEMREGMEHLEELCKVKLDFSLIESEQWEAVMTQAWKLANEIAMMYDHRDGDDIVMYGDYIIYEHKVYSKSWFREVYSATFENFMLPIPNGYDEILKTVYGDYQIRIKGGGMHDYPYYADQLRQLRKYVKNMKERVDKAGLVPAQESDEPISPLGWKDLLNGRKVILFVDDIQLYAEFGEKALDKLEQSLGIFKEYRDKVLLWWRPQAQMKTLLGLLSQELVDRYDRILREFKEAGWGICDETNEEDRAAEHCDAYYGEMGYIARNLRGQKPIMIEKMLN